MSLLLPAALPPAAIKHGAVAEPHLRVRLKNGKLRGVDPAIAHLSARLLERAKGEKSLR